MRAGDMLARFYELPAADLDTLTGTGCALVLAPHADDESLGCGGLIAESCLQGKPPVVVIATDGTGSHPGSKIWPPDSLRGLREEEAQEAVAILGLAQDRLHFLRLADGAAPRQGAKFEAAISVVAALARARGCTAIFAPWLHDPHCDHLAVQMMAREAGRRAGIPVLSYPVWGWTLAADVALPDVNVSGWRLDIARHLPKKSRAIAAHASQHGKLITDDPGGFTLPKSLLDILAQPWEVFLT